MFRSRQEFIGDAFCNSHISFWHFAPPLLIALSSEIGAVADEAMSSPK
jgi:hypothetical protein